MHAQTQGSAIERLDALVGAWGFAASAEGKTTMTGRARFEWIDGRGFVHQHSDGAAADDAPAAWHENNPLPLAAVFGLDDATGELTMLYADARGVRRVYRASFDE